MTKTKKIWSAVVMFALILSLTLESSIGASAATTKISKSEAKQIALNRAKLDKADVKKWTRAVLDNWDDDKSKEWEVEFLTKTHSYEVEINSKTGKVEDFEKHKISAKQMTKAKAKTAALKAAGVKSASVKKWISAKVDGNKWELKFTTAKYSYEVEINATSGKLKDLDKTKIKTSTDSGTKKLTKAEAKKAALKAVNVKSSEVVKWTKAKLDGKEWDLAFTTKTYRYELDVNAATGKANGIEKHKINTSTDSSSGSSSSGSERTDAKKLTEAEAKTAALKAAGVKEADVVKFTKAHLDKNEWEIDFRTAEYKFEVEVNAKTGEVVNVDKEKLPSSSGSTGSTGATATLTEVQAKDAALKAAGVKETEVTKWVKVHCEKDEWEIDFKTATHKYEVEVNAKTGEVKNVDKEKLHTSSGSTGSAGTTATLTEAQAKEAALKAAGVKESDVVKWSKVKLDKSEWEVDFLTKSHKYEVEVNAKTGEVKNIEKEKLPASSGSSGSASDIGVEKAKDIAMDHARGQMTDSTSLKVVKAKSDIEHGKLVYEVELRCGHVEYDYEIDGTSGDILDWDVDYDD